MSSGKLIIPVRRIPIVTGPRSRVHDERFMSELQQIVVGLAGHIDHGKSSLITQLTGAATDRRPEEQRRGMTVDLGFAHFDAGHVRVALIDVPGHERFVHNMLSGAAAAQFGLLVIAADDSVMPQTREHFDVIKLLGVCGGVIAVTKTDLVDEEQLEIVRLEIDELVAGTVFANAPIIPVSNLNGSGIDTLRDALVQMVSQPNTSGDVSRPFRLSIDRAFTLAGHGTIVTGTVRHGTVQTGESLLLLPHQFPVRVRQLQAQGETAEAVHAGQRAALNLSGVKTTDVRRGDELVGHESYHATQRLITSLEVLPNCRHGIRHREAVRLHVGTREVTARVLINEREAAPGSRTTAVIVCQSPVVGEYGQPVILRRLSPATTLGGGRVLSPYLPRRGTLRRFLELGGPLNSDDLGTRLQAFLNLQGPLAWDQDFWQVSIGETADEILSALKNCLECGSVIEVPTDPPTYITAEEWSRLGEALSHRCATELERRKPQRLIPRSILTHASKQFVTPGVLDCVLNELIRTRRLIARGDRIGLAQGIALTPSQQSLLEAVEADVNAGEEAPPTFKELAAKHDAVPKEIEQLVQVLVDEGRLIRVSGELAITPAVLESLRTSLVRFFKNHSSGTAAEMRDQWGVTRKYAIPYLEYLDRLEITRRVDQVRVAGPRIHDFSVEDVIS